MFNRADRAVLGVAALWTPGTGKTEIAAAIVRTRQAAPSVSSSGPDLKGGVHGPAANGCRKMEPGEGGAGTLRTSSSTNAKGCSRAARWNELPMRRPTRSASVPRRVGGWGGGQARPGGGWSGAATTARKVLDDAHHLRFGAEIEIGFQTRPSASRSMRLEMERWNAERNCRRYWVRSPWDSRAHSVAARR